jgi:hypothetical protein
MNLSVGDLQWQNLATMAIRKDWREEVLARGFGLGPLVYGRGVEEGLRREIPLNRFVAEVKEQLPPLDNPLKETTLEWLYTIGLQIRVEMQVVRQARKIVQKRVWNTSIARLQKLLTLLRSYPGHDLEIALRNALGNKKRLRLKTKAASLKRDLTELLRVCSLWRQYADWGTLRTEYKNRLAFTERLLKRRHSHILKNKDDRIAVIGIVLRAVGLEADEENISRMLRPSRLQRRRKPKLTKIQERH